MGKVTSSGNMGSHGERVVDQTMVCVNKSNDDDEDDDDDDDDDRLL